MSFLLSIEGLKQAFAIGRFSYNFISKAESVIVEIGKNELNAAINSIRDMRISNNPERELNMAITQLRSALQHFDSKADNFFVSYGTLESRWKTSLLISICYYALGEKDLCIQFRNKTENDFSFWLEEYSHSGSGKLYAKELRYNQVKDTINEIGLSWHSNYPESSLWGGLSSDNHRRFDNAYKEHKNNVKKQYVEFVHRLTQ